MFGFDALEIDHQSVVLCVGNLRRVENVVQVLVVAEFGAQLLSPVSRGLIWVLFGLVAHGVNYRRERGAVVWFPD